jgi:multidrug efflux pump subunit AcrA (membrane-fusion protein)
MEQTKINELLAKYNAGLADAAEIKAIEQLIESGKIELAQLQKLLQLDSQISRFDAGSPSARLDVQFYSALAQEKKQNEKRSFSLTIDWNSLFPRLAFAASLLIVGFVGGYLLKSPSQDKSVVQLTQQVSELKEVMMLSMLEKESATERLKAVSLTSGMDQVSKKVTSALFKTLNGDENVNVRLAALDVLMNYAKDGEVRAELIKSISVQDSPLVQVALAELMVTLQEKKSVSELKKLLKSDKTPKEVKGKIEKSISVLI